jgi:hypothetical protein
MTYLMTGDGLLSDDTDLVERRYEVSYDAFYARGRTPQRATHAGLCEQFGFDALDEDSVAGMVVGEVWLYGNRGCRIERVA